ncbi:MAG: secondary thiamine-phosphate synthase enzyme YjbQ [Deltaproteobacteria bacterium]|nr:secondary thiamine-phosphate synthase enzyme YjbQ [Deltaproteobacteria bacterium]
MKNVVREMTLATLNDAEFIDITEKVRLILESSLIQNGQLTVITQHTTTAIIINEKETGLQKDMLRFLNRIVPKSGDYEHDLTPIDGRINAHSHLQSLLLTTSQVVPVIDGKLKLGAWQSIFFVELDGPRPNRQVILQILGE